MYEDKKYLLGLCYDDIEEVCDGIYYVKDRKNHKIIDYNNNILRDNIKGKVITGINNRVYIENNIGSFHEYEAQTLQLVHKDKFCDMNRLSENAWRVSYNSTGGHGVLNKENNLVIPCAYSSIYVYSRTSSCEYLKVKPLSYLSSIICEDYRKASGAAIIRVDNNYRECDCYYAYPTEIPDVEIAVSSLNMNYGKEECKYKIRAYGKVVGKEYDSIVTNLSLDKLGMLRTYSKRNDAKKTYTTGLININGDEIVPSDRYTRVTYIGNGISVVGTTENGYGTYVAGKEVVKSGMIKAWIILGEIPIANAILNNCDEKLYIGNDGHLYSRIEKAFPLYKSKVDESIYLICLYGTWLYMNDKFRRIDPNKLEGGIKSKDKWIKL